MSDYEYDYSEEDNYDYGSDGGAEEADGNDYAILVENTFYEAEDSKRDNPAHALELFEKVLDLELENRPTEVKWRFKSLEHIVGLHFILGQSESMLKRYQELLGLLDYVTRNECNDTINNILDTISAASSSNASVSLAKMYEITSEVSKKANNERLWFNTSLKLGKMYLEEMNYSKLSQVLDELHESLKSGASKDDPNKEAYLLEVYALQISLYSATGEQSKLKEIYPKTTALSAAIQDPRIMGGIHEAGGKMKMEEEAWSDAYDEFFEGFRNYQEAGNPRAKQCLKYVVLANMIALKDINPFDSREAKVYRDDPEIQEMVQLRQAYDGSDAKQFETLLKRPNSSLSGDPFIMKYVSNLLHNIRLQVLKNLVTPFRKVSFEYLSKEINIPVDQVEPLLVILILTKRISGSIDQHEQILELSTSYGSIADNNSRAKYEALTRWSDQVDEMCQQIVGQLAR